MTSEGTAGVKVAPSILAGDHGSLRNEAIRAERAGADMIHVDVIDGHFAPNITFGPIAVKAIRSVVGVPLDVHLMINQPELHMAKFLDAGGDIVSVHAEVLDKSLFEKLEREIEQYGRQLSIALKPHTEPPNWLDREALSNVSMLLVMSVEPGFSGQRFMPEVLEKIHRLSTWARSFKRDIEVEVDGGVDDSNAARIVEAGASVLVAGSYVYTNTDMAGAIKKLRVSAVLPVRGRRT